VWERVRVHKNTISGGQVILKRMWILKLSPLWNIMTQALVFVAKFKFLFSRFGKNPVASDFAKVPKFPVAKYCYEFLP
jgi:hypothetical protein